MSSDLRSSIIDKIIESGNTTNGYFPTRYVDIANELNLSPQVISKIWKQFVQVKSLSPLKHGGGNKSGLSNGDLWWPRCATYIFCSRKKIIKKNK